MPLHIYLGGLSLLYWSYLLDPFTRRPLRRNYLRLYNDKRYLGVNVFLSSLLLIANTPFSSLPLIFIILALLINKISWVCYGRNFVFIVRGDLIKGKVIDYIFSISLMLVSMTLSIIIMIALRQDLTRITCC